VEEKTPAPRAGSNVKGCFNGIGARGILLKEKVGLDDTEGILLRCAFCETTNDWG